MRIAIRYDKRILISSDDRIGCGTGDEEGHCDGTRRLCSVGLCSNHRGKPLEKYLGPHTWRNVGSSEKEDPVEVLVLESNRIFKVVPYSTCRGCAWDDTQMCKDYCYAKDEKALCHLLGKFFSIKQVMFKEFV